MLSFFLVKEQCLWRRRGYAIWLSDAKETVFSHVGHETDQTGKFTSFCPLTPTCLFRVYFGFFGVGLFFSFKVVFVCIPAKCVCVCCCFSLHVILLSGKTQTSMTLGRAVVRQYSGSSADFWVVNGVEYAWILAVSWLYRLY